MNDTVSYIYEKTAYKQKQQAMFDNCQKRIVKKYPIEKTYCTISLF